MPKKSMLPCEVLKSIFAKKTEKNPNYSLRAFARDLNISPGRLSVILTGKEEPGDRFIQSIMTTSKLSDEEKEQIKNSQLLRYGLDLELAEGNVDISTGVPEDLTHLDVHSTLALLRTNEATDSHDWISRRLGISRERVDRAIESLIRHKIIVHRKNKYAQKVSGLIYHEKHQSPQKIAEQYHSYLMKTLPDLLKLDREHSLFATLVVPLDKKDLVKVRKILQSAFKRIKDLSDKSDRSEVYNLSIIHQKMTK